MFPDLPSGRRLSDAERLQLAELERRLQEDDPTLARAFGSGRAGPPAPPLEPLPQATLVAFAVAAVVLLVAAVIVGGVGGAAAMAASLAGTAGVVTARRLLRNGRGHPVQPADRVAG